MTNGCWLTATVQGCLSIAALSSLRRDVVHYFITQHHHSHIVIVTVGCERKPQSGPHCVFHAGLA